MTAFSNCLHHLTKSLTAELTYSTMSCARRAQSVQALASTISSTRTVCTSVPGVVHHFISECLCLHTGHIAGEGLQLLPCQAVWPQSDVDTGLLVAILCSYRKC